MCSKSGGDEVNVGGIVIEGLYRGYIGIMEIKLESNGNYHV